MKPCFEPCKGPRFQQTTSNIRFSKFTFGKQQGCSIQPSKQRENMPNSAAEAEKPSVKCSTTKGKCFPRPAPKGP